MASIVLQTLLDLARDPDPEVRYSVALAVRDRTASAGKEAIELLPVVEVLLADEGASTRLVALEACRHIGPPAARTVRRLLDVEEEADVRRAACEVLQDLTGQPS